MDGTSTLIGSNSHGFANEIAIAQYLNGKAYHELNENFREFIRFISEDNSIKIRSSTIITAWAVSDTKIKQDVVISFEGMHFYVSMKMGSGNSVHQQRIEEFLSYLRANYSVDQSVLDDFRLFVWADGTLDGTAVKEFGSDGKVKGRFSAREFKTLYPLQRANIQRFVDLNQKELLRYVLFIGKNNSRVDYIYHGTIDSGGWASSEQLLQYNENYQSRASGSTVSLGRASMQSWNPAISGSEIAETKRGQIQVKYGGLLKDLEAIMRNNVLRVGTLQGDLSEYDVVKVMNSDKQHPYWSVLREQLKLGDGMEHYFVVRVVDRVVSGLSGKKTMPKADAYVVNADLEQEVLKEVGYLVDEKFLKYSGVQYAVVEDSGISIKLENSKSFTIAKFTVDSFRKLMARYNDAMYVAAGVLIYQDETKILYNYQILEDLNVDYDEFLDYYSEKIGVRIGTISDQETLKSINSASVRRIEQIINNDTAVSDAIFRGKGVFPSPYFANFNYYAGRLTAFKPPAYYVSTGSGRSKGVYTIIFKPVRSKIA